MRRLALDEVFDTVKDLANATLKSALFVVGKLDTRGREQNCQRKQDRRAANPLPLHLDALSDDLFVRFGDGFLEDLLLPDNGNTIPVSTRSQKTKNEVAEAVRLEGRNGRLLKLRLLLELGAPREFTPPGPICAGNRLLRIPPSVSGTTAGYCVGSNLELGARRRLRRGPDVLLVELKAGRLDAFALFHVSR